MTLVKSWNMGEVEQYAELIEYGTPDFIEIKSVTYCGKSDASSLTMENVPWHTEVNVMYSSGERICYYHTFIYIGVYICRGNCSSAK